LIKNIFDVFGVTYDVRALAQFLSRGKLFNTDNIPDPYERKSMRFYLFGAPITAIFDHLDYYFNALEIGSAPQDKKHSADDNVFLNIGDNNVIREYVTINPGTVEGGSKTVIGNNNLIMAYAHIAHDCVIGNFCVMANAATLGGHVTIEDNAMIGGLSAVHQFVRLGRLAIIGGCSKVVQDVPPFSTCDGHPAKVVNTNVIGLKRAQISQDTIRKLKKSFKLLFFSGLSKTTALETIANEIESTPEVEHLTFFAKTSERGMCS